MHHTSYADIDADERKSVSLKEFVAYNERVERAKHLWTQETGRIEALPHLLSPAIAPATGVDYRLHDALAESLLSLYSSTASAAWEVALDFLVPQVRHFKYTLAIVNAQQCFQLHASDMLEEKARRCRMLAYADVCCCALTAHEETLREEGYDMRECKRL